MKRAEIDARAWLRSHDDAQSEMTATVEQILEDGDDAVVVLQAAETQRCWEDFIRDLKAAAARAERWPERLGDHAVASAVAVCRGLPAERVIWFMPLWQSGAAAVELSRTTAERLLPLTDRTRDCLLSAPDGGHGLCLELNPRGLTNEFELITWPNRC